MRMVSLILDSAYRNLALRKKFELSKLVEPENIMIMATVFQIGFLNSREEK